MSAARCATEGQVYVTSLPYWSVRTESQPLDLEPTTYYLPARGSTTVRLGGNGLDRNFFPTWRVTSSTKGGLGGYVSRQPGSNCVSNETYVTIPVGSSPGEVWTFSVSYKAGNSLRTIYDQSHVRIVFY